jgi:hypothetical protein
MPVNPIDLQVNFTQINQVSKLQTDSKDIEILRQDQASQQINKEGEKIVEDVPLTKDVEEGPKKIKEQDKNKNQKEKNKAEDKKNKSAKEEEEEKDKLNQNFKDPQLGQKIDIIG